MMNLVFKLTKLICTALFYQTKTGLLHGSELLKQILNNYFVLLYEGYLIR